MGDKPVLCKDMEDAMRVIRRIADSNTHKVIYDVETNGLNYREQFICGHVVTFGPAPSDTYYVPVRHGEVPTGNVHPHRDKRGHPFEVHLHKAAQRRDLHWVGHHFMFDLMFMWAHGIEPMGSFEDTEINAALLDEYSRSYSLANCCIVMGTTPKKGEGLYEYLAAKYGGPADRKQMGNFWRLDGQDPVGFDYAAGDGVSTWHLLDAQHAEIAKQNLTNIHRIETDLTRVLYRMKKRGVRIDLAELTRVEEHTERMIKEGMKALPPGFDFNSPKAKRALMEKHGHTDWPMTAPSKKFPNGQPSFTKDWLKTHEIGRAMVNVREWDHLKTSFLAPLRERHLQGDRVHCTYYQMANDDFGTCTGRLSCSEPNLQQVPKRNKPVAKIFRRIFVPDLGMQWWDSDLSQCEPSLLAHYSGARVLIDGYTANPPVDAHQAVTDAVLALGIQIDREDGKRLNQTLITGGGKGKIVTMLGARGEEIYDGYFQAMPEVKAFQRSASSRFEKRGYIISLLGRRSRLESRDKSYLAMNRVLQCSNADIIKQAMVRIDKLYEEDGDQCAILNNVHDALSQQGAPDKKELILESLRIFTDYGPGRTTPMRVPLRADYGIGDNWADATFPAVKQVIG